MTAIGYCRVSTDRQAADGISLDAQQAKIRAWAALHDAELIGTEIDAGLSGGRADNRPGLQNAIATACQHRAVLVVYSLSRLARSTRDAIDISERLNAAGADLVSLSENIDTTSAAGKMIFRLFAVLAEFERDQISERVSAVMAHLRATQKRAGTIPYGYDCHDGENLTPNLTELAVIAYMQRLKKSGHGLKKTAAALARRGIKTKLGKPVWSMKVISAALRRHARP